MHLIPCSHTSDRTLVFSTPEFLYPVSKLQCWKHQSFETGYLRCNLFIRECHSQSCFKPHLPMQHATLAQPFNRWLTWRPADMSEVGFYNYFWGGLFLKILLKRFIQKIVLNKQWTPKKNNKYAIWTRAENLQVSGNKRNWGIKELCILLVDVWDLYTYFASLLCLLFATFNYALVFLVYVLQILSQEHSLRKRENWQIIDISSEEDDGEPEGQGKTRTSQQSSHEKPEMP